MRGTAQFPDLPQGPPPGASPDAQAHHIEAAMDALTEFDMADTVEPIDLPALEYFATELTVDEAVADLDPVIGRSQEILRIMEILSRRTKNNPILVGDPGVGKTAIIEGLARNIVEGNVPAALLNKRIFALDLSSLIAGTMYRGEFEGRLKQIVDEAREHPEVILFIDEIHMIIGAGATSGSMDAANMLKPALARGWIRCIGATTPMEYKKHIESDGALERRFQTVGVKEPSVEDTIEILRGVRRNYEKFHSVKISDDAIVFAAEASEKYIHTNQLPDKAIDLIDEAAAALRVKKISPSDVSWRSLHKDLKDIRKQKREAIVEERFMDASLHKEEENRILDELEAAENRNSRRRLGTVGVKDVTAVLERVAGIKAGGLGFSERRHLIGLSKALKQHIFGQDDVIDKVSLHVRRAKMGISSHKRPLASFLFVGPSGTGKTEFASQLASYVFQDDNALIRLDMSEFVEGFSVSKLVGSPAGYVGYKDTALLTDAVKNKPNCVVLFDEIEKAHKDVHNLMLQILEHGELKDATGRSISFRNAIIVMTSNIGAHKFTDESLGFNKADASVDEDVRKILRQELRPEMLNRLDEIAVFKPLSRKDLLSVAERELLILKNHLLSKDLALEWSPDIRNRLVDSSDVKIAGARHIRRSVNEHIAGLIADTLLVKPKARELFASVDGDKIDLKVKTR